jgi:hypothetical protein
MPTKREEEGSGCQCTPPATATRSVYRASQARAACHGATHAVERRLPQLDLPAKVRQKPIKNKCEFFDAPWGAL